MNIRAIAVGLMICAITLPLSATRVVVDPGHGGPGGGKYGTNGDGRGAVGPNGLTEEWVNLQVGINLRFMMLMNSPFPDVALTRDEDTQRVTIRQRVEFAKQYGSDYFLSIHHNGLPLGVQGTEVWWDSTGLDDSGFVRIEEARDSIFAKKVLLRLRTAWSYANRCSSQNVDNWMQGCNSCGMERFYLLHNTRHCPCILSEASNINHYTEEQLFDDPTTGHLSGEIGELFHGWHSYHANMGFARISNRFIGGPGQLVGVDGIEWNTPVEFTWEYAEQHELVAWQNFYFNGHDYAFHHWAHLSCDDCFIDSFHVSRFYDVTVLYEFEEHIFRAYFTGGPYYAEVEAVPDPFRYAAGDTVQFMWYTTAGVDSTALVSLYLDRQNGAQGYPELLAEDVPWKERGYLNWVVNGPAGEQCRLKVVSHDIAGNQAAEVAESWNTFAVCTFLVGDADGDGIYSVGDPQHIINYIFGDPPGPPPTPHPIGSGDANCNGALSISDAVALIQYIFGGGSAPGSTCNCADYD